MKKAGVGGLLLLLLVVVAGAAEAGVYDCSAGSTILAQFTQTGDVPGVALVNGTAYWVQTGVNGTILTFPCAGEVTIEGHANYPTLSERVVVLSNGWEDASHSLLLGLAGIVCGGLLVGAMLRTAL